MRSILRSLRTVAALTGLATSTLLVTPPAEAVQLNRWSFTIQGAAQTPQDVWIAALGSNSTSWNSGGSICLGVLAQGFDVGDHVTILVDVISAGIVGTDGSPVPTTDINGNPIQYFFPGIDIPGQYYTVTDGNTFFVIADGEVVETSQPAFFPLPVGTHFPLMYTFDYITGRVEQDLALWLQDGNGRWFPFLNEGLMMTNVRRVH